MKTDIRRYICEIIGGKVYLTISGYRVGRYPLSYTFQECIEEFCDKVGWNFNMSTQERFSSWVTGHITFQRFDYSSAIKTLQDEQSNHPSR